VQSDPKESVRETKVRCTMKKGFCEAVVKKRSPDITPPVPCTSPPVEQIGNLSVEIDTRVCLSCPYFRGPVDRQPWEPIVPDEKIKPPIPSHPDIYEPQKPEKKPLRF
jgi:hypothetical protein